MAQASGSLPVGSYMATMYTTMGIDTFGLTLFYGASTQGGTAGEINNDLYQLMLTNVPNEMVPRFTWEYGSGGRESVIAVDSNLTLGQWYHMVGVRESTGGGLCTGRIYLNGQLIAEGTGLNEATGGTGGANRNWIGRDPNGAGLGWRGGSMSCAKVIDRALSAREVLGEYQFVAGERETPIITAQGTSLPTTPPLGYWKFDGDVTDEMGSYDFEADVGAGPPAYTTGYLGGTQALDTTNDVRGIERTTHDPGLILAGADMTLELLFNRVQENLASSEPMLMFFNAGDTEAANYTWGLNISDGVAGGFSHGDNLEFFCEYGAGTNAGLASPNAATEIAVGSGWRHLAFTRNAAGSVRLFIDGIMVLSGNVTPSTGGTTSRLVLGDTTGASYAEGYFQEVKVYDYTWTDDQIRLRAKELGF